MLASFRFGSMLSKKGRLLLDVVSLGELAVGIEA
jgi:hypothetical protein